MRTKKFITLVSAMVLSIGLFAQADSLDLQQNVADKLLASESKLTIGGYGQIDYNQPLNPDLRSNGILDVHRMVLLFGYRFNERAQFVTEIEYEHVSEVYIEQAFLQYKINKAINFKGGLILIPMGLVNEYHEPTAFNGVERPFIESNIAPTTWREIGAGFNGILPTLGLKYQLYVVNGFSSYNGSGKISGKAGLRGGRQKGADSFISYPNITGRIDYFGLKNLQLGASCYFGKTQSNLYNNLDENNAALVGKADSSVVGVSMLGLDARYKIGKLQLKGQYYFTSLSNTDAYNVLTKKAGVNNDLGSALFGWYGEVAYNIKLSKKSNDELIPFVRYEEYDTHYAVGNATIKNKAYYNQAIVSGIGWKITPNAVLKADLQFVKAGTTTEFSKAFNAGIGVMF